MYVNNARTSQKFSIDDSRLLKYSLDDFRLMKYSLDDSRLMKYSLDDSSLMKPLQKEKKTSRIVDPPQTTHFTYFIVWTHHELSCDAALRL